MKKIFVVTALSVIGCSTNSKTTLNNTVTKAVADPVVYANTITSSELSDYLYVYASDEFEGRETGQPGQKKAVEYLKAQYIDMGIKAAKSDGDYFQDVPLEMSGVSSASLSLNGKEYDMGTDFVTYSGSNKEKTQINEIVYAGYGIVDDKYSDYTELDVKGKTVLIKAGEPKQEDGNYVISGTDKTSKWSNIRQAFGEKIQIAKDKGATGFLFYDEANLPVLIQQYNMMKERAKQGSGRMNLKKKAEDFFYLFVNKEIANTIHPAIETESKTKTLSAQMTISVSNSSEQVTSENVVAYIKGSEKPEEYLVISSHLDHIGINADGQINNGADDDGSGTVSMLEIAQAFKQAEKDGNGPKRSIVFLHVTGEEKGLFGSEYYTDHPIFPLEKTVANLNIDMIGRTDPKRQGNPNYIYLIGSDRLSTELHNLSEEINTEYTKLELDYKYNDENDPNRFYYRSDHYNFAKHNIPIIFYFNGTHADYHKPSDTPDKIEYELMAQRAKLVFHTAWEIANRDKRIIVDKIVTASE